MERGLKKVGRIDLYVAQRLRLRRAFLKMSQSYLGERLGVTYQQVQKYERGVNRIGAGRLFDMAQVLGVPIAYFYFGVEGVLQESIGFSDMESIQSFAASSEGQALSVAFMSLRGTARGDQLLKLIERLSLSGR